jgi:hypothetical protein
MNGAREAMSPVRLGLALRSCAMPREEIRAVLEAEDADTVRRHVELHIEWLEERLARQRRVLRDVGRVLAGRRAGSEPLGR